MLRLVRRHLKSCGQTSTLYRRCRCPIHVHGTLGGEKVRRALDLVSWEAATDLVRSWEASGEVGVSRAEIPEIAAAVQKFIADAEARNLAPATLGKLRRTAERLADWSADKGLRVLRQLDVDRLREFRESWALAPVSARKNLERLRSFFRFCVDADWMKSNPAKALRPPKTDGIPTLPFTAEEFEKILDACDKFPIKGRARAKHRRKLRALCLLLRYSGLRITDGVYVNRDRFKGHRLFLRTEKTGTMVFCPLPEKVIEALEEIGFNFVDSAAKPKHVVGSYQRSFGKISQLAGVENVHAHRFRDSFSVALLEKGVPIETVSILLGHSSVAVTEKHYRPFVKSLQDNLEAAVMQSW